MSSIILRVVILTKISYGVPWGSILGPLLFLIYINDLPRIVGNISIPFLFADDITNSNPIISKQTLKKYSVI